MMAGMTRMMPGMKTMVMTMMMTRHFFSFFAPAPECGLLGKSCGEHSLTGQGWREAAPSSPRGSAARMVLNPKTPVASFECTEPVDNESHRSEIEQPFRKRLLPAQKKDISADLYLSPG